MTPVNSAQTTSTATRAVAVAIGLILSIVVAAGLAPQNAGAASKGQLSKAKKPDLQVKAVKLSSAKIAAGDELTITATIANRGRKTAGKSTTGYWLSYNAKFDKGDVVAGSAVVKKIKRGKSRKAVLKVKLPGDLPAGHFYVIACTDAIMQVKEGNERNNCKAVKITVTKGPGPTAPTGPTGPTPPVDSDGDGIADASDNCPTVANANQADGDGDLIGDVCDPCPADANPNNGPCPATVYAVRAGSWPTGAKVSVPDVIVTAKVGNHVYGQVKPGEPTYIAAGNSGISIDFTGPVPSVGDLIKVDGTVTAQQSINATSSQTTQSSLAPPPPTTVTALELAAYASTTYRDVIVQVNSPDCVSTCAPSATSWQLVNSANQFYAFNTLFTLPSRSFPLASIAGVATVIGGNSGLMPRNAADVIELP